MIEMRLCKGIVFLDINVRTVLMSEHLSQVLHQSEHLNRERTVAQVIMKIPTTQRLSERQTDIAADDGDFVTIDLDKYEKNIGVPEAVNQESGPKPVRLRKTKVVILVLSLSLVTLILMVALIFYLAKQKDT